MDTKEYQFFYDLGESLQLLEEAAANANTSAQALIQQFEFCVTQFWAALKTFCSQEGFIPNSNQALLVKAYEIKLIDDDLVWVDILADRNLMMYITQATLVEKICTRIKKYTIVLTRNYQRLKEKYQL